MAASDPAQAVLLVDGECALCSSLVHFLAQRDPTARLRFGTFQSRDGLAVLHQLQQAADLSTAVLIEYTLPKRPSDAREKLPVCSTRSTAILRYDAYRACMHLYHARLRCMC